jgi:hypothetical protein
VINKESSTWHFCLGTSLKELSFRADVWEDDIGCHLSPLHLGTINDIILQVDDKSTHVDTPLLAEHAARTEASPHS